MRLDLAPDLKTDKSNVCEIIWVGGSTHILYRQTRFRILQRQRAVVQVLGTFLTYFPLLLGNVEQRSPQPPTSQCRPATARVPGGEGGGGAPRQGKFSSLYILFTTTDILLPNQKGDEGQCKAHDSQRPSQAHDSQRRSTRTLRYWKTRDSIRTIPRKYPLPIFINVY